MASGADCGIVIPMNSEYNEALPEGGLVRARTRRRDLHQAMEALEFAVAGPAGEPDTWLASVRTALSGLRDALQAHVDEVESPHGLLAEIVDQEPRLTAAADQLRADHPDLLLATERAMEAAAEHDPAPSRVRRRVVSLLGRLTMHRQAGSDLVYEAYSVDIGGTG